MKKINLIILAFLVGSLLVNAKEMTAVREDGKTVILNQDGSWKLKKMETRPQNAQEFHFRKSRWGFTKRKVLLSEPEEPIHEKDDVVAYEGQIAGLDVWIVYIFVDDKLVRSKYVVVEKHTNANDFISDYEKLKSGLTRKYGEPDKDQNYWKNDLYKDNYDQWGMALKVGHLVYIASWNTDETDIGILLNGENYDISLAVEYTSTALESLENKKNEESTMNAL
jgi:hypothetical protein